MTLESPTSGGSPVLDLRHSREAAAGCRPRCGGLLVGHEHRWRLDSGTAHLDHLDAHLLMVQGAGAPRSSDVLSARFAAATRVEALGFLPEVLLCN